MSTQDETLVFFFILITIVLPLALFVIAALLGSIVVGAGMLGYGFTDLGGGLGFIIYICLWIFAFPVMAILALIVGAGWLLYWKFNKPTQANRVSDPLVLTE